MESARHASAIHERRTGRVFRVTEPDLINEAMYEEINDLPAGYRRLNANLQIESVDFDRRLLAYLSSQIATRQAVSDRWRNEQSHSDTYAMIPSMCQEPSSHVPLYHTADGTATNYRTTPCPPVPQSIQPRLQVSFASTTTPCVADSSHQHMQSLYISLPDDGRHTSPPTNLIIQAPHL